MDNRGIPPLAGLCDYASAAQPGLSVDETVTRLKRYNFVLRRLNETAAAHLARTPEWEIKCGLGLHIWLDAEHCSAIRTRVAEMREPPLHLDDVPEAGLGALLDELVRSRDTPELLTGIYRVVRPELLDAMQRHVGQTNRLLDHPTHRLLQLICFEQTEMLEWGRVAADAVVGTDEESVAEWTAHLRSYLIAAGGIDGTARVTTATVPEPRADGGAFEMDPVPRRDARFRDPFNCSAKVDYYYVDESLPLDERVLALAYKRLREMDVPEWMGPILVKTTGKPWDYYRELSRQLWDETRHAMLGEVAFVRAGVPFYDYPVDMVGSAMLNTEFTPLEAHLVLWRIEQGLMPGKTGKRFEWKVADSLGDPYLRALQDYDWADEVLHAQIGRRLLADEYPDTGERQRVADALIARWDESIGRWAALSEQEPWWPEFVARVRAAAAKAG